ncbi:Rve domain-containing protein [Abeliophyllum distichum]|uniref:Rve domain-containing protein n=1 Tax=Abeliophyllum distichum TaxID=126358 RepID=A0ABD1NUX2_9LAMI
MQPHQELTTVSSPWPFAKWGLDFIGPMPKGRGNACHAIVAIDYFTKWVEAEPMMKITEANTSRFIWKSIICRFGIPNSLVSDNGKQFDNKKIRELVQGAGHRQTLLKPPPPPSQWSGRGRQQNHQIHPQTKT